MVLAWRQAENEAKVPMEMALVGEADAESHFPDLVAAAQHRLGLGHAQQQLIAMRGNTQGGGEQPHQVKLAQSGHGSEFIQMDGFGVMGAQMGDGALDGARALPGQENRRRMQGGALSLIQQGLRLAGQRQDDADKIGLPQHLVEREKAGPARVLDVRRRLGMVVEDFHAETGAGLASDHLPDGVQAENAERFGARITPLEEVLDAAASRRLEPRESDGHHFPVSFGIGSVRESLAVPLGDDLGYPFTEGHDVDWIYHDLPVGVSGFMEPVP